MKNSIASLLQDAKVWTGLSGIVIALMALFGVSVHLQAEVDVLFTLLAAFVILVIKDIILSHAAIKYGIPDPTSSQSANVPDSGQKIPYDEKVFPLGGFLKKDTIARIYEASPSAKGGLIFNPPLAQGGGLIFNPSAGAIEYKTEEVSPPAEPADPSQPAPAEAVAPSASSAIAPEAQATPVDEPASEPESPAPSPLHPDVLKAIADAVQAAIKSNGTPPV